MLKLKKIYIKKFLSPFFILNFQKIDWIDFRHEDELNIFICIIKWPYQYWRL